jgi:tetratricopeptide (TPR) repeat protein
MQSPGHRALIATGLLAGATLAPSVTFAAATDPDPAAGVLRAVAEAEAGLRRGELQEAESHYRDALAAGWLLLGTIDRVEGRLDEAGEDFRKASVSAFDDRLPLEAMALVDVERGQASTAAQGLARLVARHPDDVALRRLLAQALAASGERERSVSELEEAHGLAPSDPEVAFALATGYLGLKRTDDAARLFAQVLKARPMARAHLLVARAYRDAAVYDRARAQLREALRMDPTLPRAHYELGRAAIAEKGRAGLDEAIAEFEREVKLAPDDPAMSFELGMALVEVQRPEEALPHLQRAAEATPPQAKVLYYLGRALVALDRPAEAEAPLGQALQLALSQGANREALKMIRLQLGRDLQRLGREDEAKVHFDEAQKLSLEGTEQEREQLARYLSEAPEKDAGGGHSPAVPIIESSPVAGLDPAARKELRARVTEALARSYLNLGIVQAQGGRFARAAEEMEKAAAIAPDFPQLQSSLGVAYFNAREFEKATGPLGRALAVTPGDTALRRTLALAWLNSQAYAKAADLLREDPDRLVNPSLQFAYGLALVKSDQAAEAEPVFSSLLARHGDSAPVNVLLGQAHAQLGDFDKAIASFQRALELQAGVEGANAGLGVIYLRQGKPEEAEKALRAELAHYPGDVQSLQNLAVVLDTEQRPEEAVPLLERALALKPDFADSRYLLGKILLAQGDAAAALSHLEAAVRLAPGDANIHYQLGRAYQRLGRVEESQKEFEVFRQIKAKR